MRIGFSSYSFHQLVGTGQMTLPEVVDWIVDHGGEHLEIAVGFAQDNPLCDLADLPHNTDLLDALRRKLDERKLPLSQIAMPATFWTPEASEDGKAPGQGEQGSTATGIEAELQRVRDHIDLCAELGVELLRHDVCHGFFPGDDLALFEQALPTVVKYSKEVAQYAASKGVKTSIENHGYFFQGSERVRRVIAGVDEPNFGTTLDVGNFLCRDEDPVVATTYNLPHANIVHFKDFYIRDTNPGDGFFPSHGGKFLRGAVVGHGDIDMPRVAKAVKASGYDGFITIEFEGSEPALLGCEWGLKNTRRLLEEA